MRIIYNSIKTAIAIKFTPPHLQIKKAQQEIFLHNFNKQKSLHKTTTNYHENINKQNQFPMYNIKQQQLQPNHNAFRNQPITLTLLLYISLLLLLLFMERKRFVPVCIA